MSGIEVAGIAVAILPLLISTAERYDDCFHPLTRYRKFATEVRRFQQQLKNQKIIFRSQCRILLTFVIDRDDVARTLSAPRHSSPSNSNVETRLAEQFGESKEACGIIVSLIDERLRDIEKESRDLEAAVNQDQTTEFFGDKEWRHRVGKKLRFSFSKSRLEQNISALKSFNDDFRSLNNDIKTLMQAEDGYSYQTHASQRSHRPCDKEIERYRIIGKASEQVYAALGRACTKHTEHLAHFCMEAEKSIFEEVPAPQVKFRMAFTHLSLVGSSIQGEPIWFVIDSTVGDSVNIPGSEHGSCHDVLAQSLKRQLEPSQDQAPKKPKKSVRFQTPERPVVTRFLPEITTSPLMSTPCIRRDFCDYLRVRFRQPNQENVCVGMLENTENCKHRVYAPPSIVRSGCRQATTLSQLISTISKQGSADGLPQYERLRLARTLATAVLQFHATPWLKLEWRSEDIYFFGINEKNFLQPTLTAPHVNVKFKGPDGSLSQATGPVSQKLAPNPLLFSLGVILLEIAYSSTLHSLQQPGDLENGQESRHTEFFAAKRLANSLGREMGGTYRKVVKKLLQCDFGCGDDLNDPKLQALFYRDVVCELERLERGFRALQLDD